MSDDERKRQWRLSVLESLGERAWRKAGFRLARAREIAEASPRACRFAAQKHLTRPREGKATEPFMDHLIEVAELVEQATFSEEVDLVLAAILHDTIEDTETTSDELRAAFGPQVAGLVMYVTDNKSLPAKDRRALQVAPYAWNGGIITIADQTSHLRALAASPPPGWTRERRDEYVARSRGIVAECRHAGRHACVALADQFDAAAHAVAPASA